ncbi:MAG: hypothetical protein GY850_26325 [bacterium]|nr:hypothetical protein [bacterium]
MSKLKAALAVLIIVLFVCPPAFAQESSSATSETKSEATATKNWEFSLAPMYLWAVSIKGDQTVKGHDVDLDIPFSDIFDNLNGALIFHFEGVRKQSWGFMTDFNYINLKPDDGKIDIEYTQILAEAAAFYRLIEGDLTIDGFGGLRYSSMEVELDFPGGRKDPDQRKDWVDPFVGLRWKWRFADKWATNLRADAGGFSIGSDRSFNLVGLVDFKPWQHVGFFGGYRGLYQDYSSGSGGHKFKYDAWMHGPVLGLNINW